MASDSGRTLSGVLIHDERLTFSNRDTATISATQSGPRPGEPVSSAADALMSLSVRGGQDTDLDVDATQTGMSGIDTDKVHLIQKADTATLWDGFSDPTTLLDFHVLKAHLAYAPIVAMTRLDRTGKLVILTAHQTNAVSASSILQCTVWDPSDNSTTNSTVLSNAVSGDYHFNDIAITAFPDGMLLAMVHHGSPYPSNYFDAHYSTDDGATWALYAENVIDAGAGIGATAGGSRSAMVYSGQDTCWVRQHNGASNTDIFQYASTGRGTEFEEVRRWTAAASAYPTDVNLLALPDGRLALVYRGTSDYVYIRRVGSAWDPFEDATEDTAYSTAMDCVSSHVDEDGTIYVFGTESSSGDFMCGRSYDLGDTWETLTIAAGATTSDYFSDCTSFSAMGQQFVAGSMVASTGTTDNAVGMMVFGGWGVGEINTLQGTSVGTRHAGVIGGWEAADNVANWTSAGSGATWTADDDNGWSTLSSSANSDYVYVSQSGRYDALATGRVGMTAGGSLTAGANCVRLNSGDGVNTLQTEIRFSFTDDQVRWVCNSAGGTTVETITHDFAAADFQFKFWIDADTEKAHLVYKASNSLTWIYANSGAGQTLTEFASTTQGLILYGARDSGTVTAQWIYFDSHFGSAAGGLHVKTAQTDLHGKAIGAFPYPLPNIGPDAQVARLATFGGPGRIADAWSVAVSADYPLSNLYPLRSPSPAAVWRSTGTTEEIPLAWDNTYDTRWGNSIAISVAGCNFPTAVLEGQTGGGGWTTLATLDMDTGFDSLTYDRTGEMVFPSTTGSAVEGGRYIWRNEFAGANVDLGSGKYRKVLRNTAGQWVLGANTSRHKARFYLDGIDDTEGTSAATCAIWSTRATTIVHNVSDYDQFRLRIPSGSNADGYWQIGACVIGGLAVIGKQHDLGWSWRRDPNAETQRSRAGTSYARRQGTAPRSLTLSYNSGYDLTTIRDNSAAVDYLAAGSGNPLAAHDDVGFLLAELVEELDSGEIPVVALPAIPDTGTTLTDPWDFIYARLETPVQLDHVVGDERSNEVYRGGTITFSEIV